MWQSFRSRNRQLAAGLAIVLTAVLTGPSFGQTQSGGSSGTYGAPTWGQAGSSTWGTQSGNIGQGGWQYNRGPQANQPAGNSAYPNANGRPFGSTSERDPLTSRGRRF
jgi:hypothetical protein